MSEAPDPRRHALLAEIVPALVHRLNNLLAVAGGCADLCASRPGERDPVFLEQVEHLHESVAEAGTLLAALSELAASPRSDVAGEAELRPVLDALRWLPTAFANESGVALVIEQIGGDGVVLAGPRRLEGALQVALLGAIAGLARSRAPRRRVRLRAVVGAGRVAFALTAYGSLDERDAARVGADLRALGPVRTRSSGSALGWRAVLFARCELTVPGAVAARPRESILLVEPDEVLADLVASVLREEGYRVAVAPDLAAAERAARGAGLLLLASAAAAGDRERARRLTARLPRALLLGEPVPGLAGVGATLAQPLRPDDLVRVVAELCESR